MPWECYECTFVQEGSPSGRGPCIMCMHDNPLRIKVEVEDASASPSPAPKITGTDVEMKDLMSDVGSLKAFAEATTESATAVADIIDPIEHGGLVKPCLGLHHMLHFLGMVMELAGGNTAIPCALINNHWRYHLARSCHGQGDCTALAVISACAHAEGAQATLIDGVTG